MKRSQKIAEMLMDRRRRILEKLDGKDMWEFSETLDKYKKLTPREQKIVEMRYGLDDNKLKTLREVGEEFGVDANRIRQIEATCFEKLNIKL